MRKNKEKQQQKHSIPLINIPFPDPYGHVAVIEASGCAMETTMTTTTTTKKPNRRCRDADDDQWNHDRATR